LSARPNFFIVGAPKCGTTAFYEYLRTHPNILMPEVKEPHYFATDLGAYPSVKTLEDHTRLFEKATPQHLRIGEASVYYLRSSVATANIREYNPDSQIIAMLRNPVDMVYSLHSELLDWSLETVSDFETAWRMQERRSPGIDLPRGITSPLLVQYAEVGRFGTQVERFRSMFPSARVKLILYDDFAVSPQRVYGGDRVPGHSSRRAHRVSPDQREPTGTTALVERFLPQSPARPTQRIPSLKRTAGGGGNNRREGKDRGSEHIEGTSSTAIAGVSG
jgi:sulfotransferase family protein